MRVILRGLRTAAGRVTPGLIITLACLFCAEGKTVVRLACIVDRHRFDPDPDPNFCVDADPHADPA
jgi:hypothetical protein